MSEKLTRHGQPWPYDFECAACGWAFMLCVPEGTDLVVEPCGQCRNAMATFKRGRRVSEREMEEMEKWAQEVATQRKASDTAHGWALPIVSAQRDAALDRLAALENKCALLAASLKKADAENERLRAALRFARTWAKQRCYSRADVVARLDAALAEPETEDEAP